MLKPCSETDLNLLCPICLLKNRLCGICPLALHRPQTYHPATYDDSPLHNSENIKTELKHMVTKQ